MREHRRDPEDLEGEQQTDPFTETRERRREEHRPGDPRGVAEDAPLHDVDPGDEDGLPDGPARFRVPS